MIYNYKFSPAIAILIGFSAFTGVGCSEEKSADTTTSTKNVGDQENITLAEDIYENIQVLNGTPAIHLTGVMNYFWNSLGTHCAHCHVLGKDGWKMESDEKEAKRTARRMISMVKNINKEYFGGGNRINCFTCHRGSLEPVKFMQLPGNAMTFSEYRNRVALSIPSLDDVLAQYQEAVGINNSKENSGIISFEGTFKDASGWRSQHYQIYINDSDNYLFTAAVLGDKPDTTTYGFTDDSTWIKKGTSVQRADDHLAYDVKSFLRLLNFRDLLSDVKDLTIVRVDSVDGEKVAVIKRPIDEFRWEEFYISSESGLPLKRIVYTKTPVVIYTIEAAFGDYREVDGILIAHNFVYENGNSFTSGLFKIKSVKFGIDENDVSFSPPE
ncbi:c-type cytochrome [Candidatus Marinimicrobia bacterium MT.SAG.3]|nr:c-type cytochrome [Candidatus Marinimicrobia bacterium MT.SAG.3]